jgi:hypothetical protein
VELSKTNSFFFEECRLPLGTDRNAWAESSFRSVTVAVDRSALVCRCILIIFRYGCAGPVSNRNLPRTKVWLQGAEGFASFPKLIAKTTGDALHPTIVLKGCDLLGAQVIVQIQSDRVSPTKVRNI